MPNYKDVFLNALNISPQKATPIGKTPDSTPSAPNYNALLWKKVNTDRSMIHVEQDDGGYENITNDGSFFVVATFSGDTSPPGATLTGNKIYENFTEMSFDSHGNLRTAILGSIPLKIYIWNNPLAKSPWNEENINKPECIKFQKINDIVVSYNGKFILMRDPVLSTSGKQIYYLLYNPIHSISYKNYYKNLSETNHLVRLSDPLPQKYCEIMADKTQNPLYMKSGNPTDTTSTVYQQYGWGGGLANKNLPGDGKRNYGDISCNLLYNRECVNFAAGSSGELNIPFTNSSYGDLSNNCSCSATQIAQNKGSLGRQVGVINMRRDDEKISIKPDSFISDFGLDARRAKISDSDPSCPRELKINNCNVSIAVAGDLNQSNSKTVTLCGVTAEPCKYSNIVWNKECVPNEGGKLNTTDGTNGTMRGYQRIEQDAFGGTECDKPNNEGKIWRTKTCVLEPIDCTYDNWVETSCPDCGTGQKRFIRRVKDGTSAKYGGKCDGPYVKCVNNNGMEITCPTSPSSPTSVTSTPSPSSPTSVTSTTSSPAPTSSPTSSNTMMYVAAVGVVVLGIGIYFYLSKKAK